VTRRLESNGAVGLAVVTDGEVELGGDELLAVHVVGAQIGDDLVDVDDGECAEAELCAYLEQGAAIAGPNRTSKPPSRESSKRSA
jgi:hypothetical protein